MQFNNLLNSKKQLQQEWKHQIVAEQIIAQKLNNADLFHFYLHMF